MALYQKYIANNYHEEYCLYGKFHDFMKKCTIWVIFVATPLYVVFKFKIFSINFVFFVKACISYDCSIRITAVFDYFKSCQP